jgi:hypothetical protein
MTTAYEEFGSKFDFWTGSGKSLIVTEMERRSVEFSGRVLIAVHVRELIEQDVKERPR